MVARLHQINFAVHRAARKLVVIFLLAVILNLAVAFFLVIATLGVAGAVVYALGNRWDGRRPRRYGARAGKRLAIFTARATRYDTYKKLYRKP